jgi:hypothetical protein
MKIVWRDTYSNLQKKNKNRQLASRSVEVSTVENDSMSLLTASAISKACMMCQVFYQTKRVNKHSM